MSFAASRVEIVKVVGLGGFVWGAHAGEACCARPWRGVGRNTVAAGGHRRGELRLGRARRKGVLREAVARGEAQYCGGGRSPQRFKLVRAPAMWNRG